MKILIFIILLLTLLHAQEELDMKQKIDIIDKHRFGSTLLDTIYLQLQTQEPIERLLGTLEQIEDRYVTDQKEEDQYNKEYQDQCSLDLKSIDGNINQSDSERIKLESKLEGELYPKEEILQKLIQQKQDELDNLNQDLTELDSQREQDQEEYEFKIHEHEDVIGILTQTKQLFQENLQSNSNDETVFIQKLSDRGLDSLQKHFNSSIKKAAKFQYRASWGKMFKALATITSRVEQLQDSSLIDNIILLIDQLLEKVSDSMDLEKFQEQKKIDSYNKTRNLLIISINTTNTILAQTISDLNVVQEFITQTLATLDNTKQRLNILQESRNDRFIVCEQEAQDYEDQRKIRSEDRDVVSETIGLLNRSLRTLKEQLALRMDAGEEFDY